jgi:hypothetical protein
MRPVLQCLHPKTLDLDVLAEMLLRLPHIVLDVRLLHLRYDVVLQAIQ